MLKTNKISISTSQPNKTQTLRGGLVEGWLVEWVVYDSTRGYILRRSNKRGFPISAILAKFVLPSIKTTWEVKSVSRSNFNTSPRQLANRLTFNETSTPVTHQRQGSTEHSEVCQMNLTQVRFASLLWPFTSLSQSRKLLWHRIVTVCFVTNRFAIHKVEKNFDLPTHVTVCHTRFSFVTNPKNFDPPLPGLYQLSNLGRNSYRS
jgi:hypothetical protein